MITQTQTQHIREIQVKRGRVLEIHGEFKSVRLTLTESGGDFWHAIIRIDTQDYIKEDYAVLDYNWGHSLDIAEETGKEVLETLFAAVCCGKIERAEEDVYYANARGLDLFYFAKQKLVYVVDREGNAHELGSLDDATLHARDIFEGEDLAIIEEFVGQVKRLLSCQ